MSRRPGAVVIVHLVNPTEKFWGVLERLEPVGVTCRGLNLDSLRGLDDRDRARARCRRSGSSTMFVPLFRVERIFLDEQVGEVESYRQRFERRTGRTVAAVLGLRRLKSRNPRRASAQNWTLLDEEAGDLEAAREQLGSPVAGTG